MKLKKALPILSIASLFLSTGCIDPSKVKDKEKIVKVMAKNISKKFKSVPQITIEKFRQIPKEEVVLVDVRPKVEREVSIIPNAISVEEFEKNSHQYKEKKVPTVQSVLEVVNGSNNSIRKDSKATTSKKVFLDGPTVI